MKKFIKLYCFSFVFLFIALSVFIYNCLSYCRLILFIISAVALALFVIVYKISEEKLHSPDGYSLPQAYLFYKKCRSKGLKKSISKFEKDEIEKLFEIAKNDDLTKDRDGKFIKKLYKCGYDVYKLFEKK